MIPSESTHLQVAALTHPGMKRRNNEDRYSVSAYHLSESNPTPALFAIIADGVGGHRAGEVAAEIAVELISQQVAASDASQPVGILKSAILQASQRIYQRSMVDPEQQGMGTTCVCAWVIQERLFAASVGDSRLYLIRGGQIYQLTIDHTWIQEAIDSGVLMPQDARSHPNAHVLRRYLGSQQPVEPDFRLRLGGDEADAQSEANQGMRLLPGDRLLLCSDGLTDLISQVEILDVMLRDGLIAALDRLIRLANEHGGHDNITLIGLQVPDEVNVNNVIRHKPRRSKIIQAFWVMMGVVVFSLLIGAGYIWFREGDFRIATPTPSQLPLRQPVILATGSPLPMITPSSTNQEVEAITITLMISPTIEERHPPEFATYTPWPTSTP